VRFSLIMSEVGGGLKRNLSMVVAVVLVTFISLTFVGAAMLLQMQIGQMKGYWYDRAEVAVYLCTDVADGGNCNSVAATPEQIAQVKQQLSSPPLKSLVTRFEFENHEQAYAKYQKQFAGSQSSGFVTPDFLPETYWVNLKDPSQSDVLVESLSGKPGVDEVVDQRKYLQPIFSALSAASYTAIGIAGLMLIAAVLLIAMTIRLSAFSRRRELGIMRLVGASNRFIQTPFILEGVIAALVGSIAAGAAVFVGVKFFVQDYLAVMLKSTPFVGMDDVLIVVPVLLVIGASLAAISASIAISRDLKV
jgi:cell division transport system permease protein